MNKFKDKYYLYDGTLFDYASASVKGYASNSVPRIGGDGTRDNPYSSSGYFSPNQNNSAAILVLGGGTHYPIFSYMNDGRVWATGQSKYTSQILPTMTFVNIGSHSHAYRDLEMIGIKTIGYVAQTITVNTLDCVLAKALETTPISFGSISRTILKCGLFTKTMTGLNNTFIDLGDATLSSAMYRTSNRNIFKRCRISISDQTDINQLSSNYNGFDECLFKIGSESNYTLIIPMDSGGSVISNPTESDFINEFVKRVEAQGLVATIVDTTPLDRWVFDNGSTIDGVVLKGSIFEAFEIRKIIKLGHDTDARKDVIRITPNANIPSSFSPSYADSRLDFSQNSAVLDTSVDISKREELLMKSNIIWLGGFKQMNAVDIINNIPMEYGVQLDTTPNILNKIESGYIVENELYVVRSNDSEIATISYNGTNYASSLSYPRSNIFRGTAGVADFIDSIGNAEVYLLLDVSNQLTMQMRIVNDIPAPQIKSGNLQAGYWYLVEHDTDQSSSDYITYGGVNYPPLSSFLVTSPLTFTPSSPNIHLRRCWRDDYDDPDVEVTDKTFWSNVQKPKWFHVDPHVMKCLMKGNSGVEVEMQMDDDGNYIASGHDKFYGTQTGDIGYFLPSYPIRGSFIQIRIDITTMNPM